MIKYLSLEFSRLFCFYNIIIFCYNINTEVIYMITRKEFFFNSYNGISKIYSVVWVDETIKIHKGIIQLVHGMSEHILRYEDFANFMAEKGFIVCGNDHIGHGKSVSCNDDLGYFGEGEYNYLSLVEDVKTVTLKIKNMYPNLSVTLIGHSMGSFIARKYSTMYPRYIDRAIFIGTSGAKHFLDFGIFFCKMKMLLGKGRQRGHFVNKLGFGAYNSKFENVKTDYDWICSKRSIVKDFVEDEKCSFIFTYAGYYDLFRLLKDISSINWYKKFDRNIPVLLLAGKNDPVGDYGKGVIEVYRRLKKEGVDVKIVLYKNMRHEILNEKNRVKVYCRIYQWINENMN